MKALAEFSYRRRRFVVLGWIALLVGIWVVSSGLAGEFKTEFELPDSESARAIELMEERGSTSRSGFTGQIVFEAEQGVNDPQVRQAMEKFFADVSAALEGEEIISPYATGNEYQISQDGKVAFAEVNLSNREQEQFTADAEAVKELQHQVQLEGLRVELGGDIFAEFSEFSSEAFGLLAAVIILLIAFGSLLAMGLPITTALFGVGVGAALIGLLTRVLAVPEFTTQVAAMIGIGVGIDYALLIVTRYRQGLHDGFEPREAVIMSIDTSGRAVLFAGITVVISLLGMFMMNMDFMRSLSIGAILAVLMTMFASLTLLPALLGFTGRNIDKLGLPHRRAAEGDVTTSFWYRWSRFIQAHPWPMLIASSALLIILTIPAFSLRLGFSDAGNRQETDTTRRAYDTLSRAFGPGFNGPFLIVVDTPAGAADGAKVQQVADTIAGTEGVASVSQPIAIPNANLSIINVFADSAPQDKETTELVHRLRQEAIPPVAATTGLEVYTSGVGPIVVDFSDYIAERLPWFVGAVLLLSFLLLLMVFHSLVVPIKAVIMNMLSIGAAFGTMIAVFQMGIGASLIGLGKEGPIEAWGPMMMFAIVFGLSMDYEVFLLTRVREEFDRNGGDNARAVADGLAATGRVISAAAAIMVCVFGAFILGDDRALKMVGFGLAVSIFIDATIVRLILVPSAMELLGAKNWWAPSWLVKILPTIRVEASDHVSPRAVAPGD